jgi:hypothetical protein
VERFNNKCLEVCRTSGGKSGWLALAERGALRQAARVKGEKGGMLRGGSGGRVRG